VPGFRRIKSKSWHKAWSGVAAYNRNSVAELNMTPLTQQVSKQIKGLIAAVNVYHGSVQTLPNVSPAPRPDAGAGVSRPGQSHHTLHRAVLGTSSESFCFAPSSALRLLPEAQNHRMVWVGHDLIDHLIPTPLPRAGTPSTSPGCSEPRPTWP